MSDIIFPKTQGYFYMKRILFAIIICCIVFAVLSLEVDAATTVTYSVDCSDGNYRFLKNGLVSAESASLQSLLDGLYALGQPIVFLDISTNETVSLDKGEYIFTGKLTAASVILNEGASICIRDCTLSVKKGLVINGGVCTLNGGVINMASGSICMNDSALSAFTMNSGEIVGNGNEPLLIINQGIARLYSGRVVNTGGVAIESKNDLRIGDVEIRGIGYDVVENDPIQLLENQLPKNRIRVKYNGLFEKGTSTVIASSVGGQSGEWVQLFDANGCEQEVTVIGEKACVHLPFNVKFIYDGAVIYESELLRGEKATPPDFDAPNGYSHIGWFTSIDGAELYDFASTVDDNLTLHAICKLAEPFYIINGIRTVYDGEEQVLTFSELQHPLDGIYTYEWYNEFGKLVSTSHAVSLKNVADSGGYYCKLSFTSGTQTVTVRTPKIPVEIQPRLIDVPRIPACVYTGRAQYPDILPDGFLFDEKSYTDSGTYSIALTLSDPQNTRWSTTESNVVEIDFVIEMAKNKFTSEITIADTYCGAEITYEVHPLFGNPSLLFSKTVDGAYSTTPPNDVGEYFVKVLVPGTDNYYELCSEPVAFNIINDELLVFSVASYPTKSVYHSFERFDSSGLSFAVKYASGLECIVYAEDVSFSYATGDCFSVTHSYIFAEYMGQRIILPVTVLPASYELNVNLLGAAITYDGAFHSLELVGEMPVGADGSRPYAEIVGGGTDAGSYHVTAYFRTDSVEYTVPPPVTAILEILPRSVCVEWGITEFVYDGSTKIPDAGFKDIYGVFIPLSVTGGASLAGSDYVARANTDDGNYLLENPSTTFTILRASYDLTEIVWTPGDFVYDGSLHTVTVSSLPNGVSVVGYVDNAATNAGEYTARVVLSYDTRNYYAIPEQTCTYRILRADYDLSVFSFIGGEHLYDGLMHYPTISGSMPTGYDGISLEFRFERGVMNVTDSPFVTVSFSTASNNYNTPEAITVPVSVIPRGIYVKWSDAELVYTGTWQSPYATADECLIITDGAACDVGIYTASACTDNSNYRILNPTVRYRISPAPNLWISELTVNDVFVGNAPSPRAEALFGNVEYLFYSDYELTEPVKLPLTVGRYYVVATADAGANYESLSSLPMPFSVKPILPYRLIVSGKTDYSAFDEICENDLSVTLVNNDGSTRDLRWDEYEISYLSADGMRYGDGSVSVVYGALVFEHSVTVTKASYDMSAIYWTGNDVIYSGEPIFPQLIGLPEGVIVREYVGAGVINAGEYTVTAVLDYDTVNYNEPPSPSTMLTVKKRCVTPSVEQVVYDGQPHGANAIGNLFNTEDVYFTNAGEYEVAVYLIDSGNYYLERETAVFVISPAVISVKVNDSDRYWFDDVLEFGITLEKGITVSLDELCLEYEVVGDEIVVRSHNPNYLIDFTPGRVIQRNRFSPIVTRTIFICLLLSLLIIFAVIIIVIRRDDVSIYCRRLFRKRAVVLCDGGTDAVAECVSVGVDRADELIGDSIARSLVKSADRIETNGRKRYCVNIDELDSMFEAGERVDVNVLKSRGIIPNDAGFVKILARGTLSKPLTVYANAYSLTAVKMIALTGGRVYRVKNK